MRRDQRITQTQDLSVRLWIRDSRLAARPVLNLGEGGMLVTDLELDVGEIASFEIAGSYFRYAGLAEAVHRTDGATGLRVVRWQGQAERALRSLIAARTVGQRIAAVRADTNVTPVA